MSRPWPRSALFLATAASALMMTGCPPWRPPERVVFSNDRAVALKVSPGNERIGVFDAGNPNAEKWRISYDVWNDDCLVTDDGERVITLFNGPRHKLASGVGLRFWTRDGQIKQHLLADLVQDPKARGQVGTPTTFSFTPWFRYNVIRNDELWVLTIDGADLRFSLTTGDMLPGDAPGGNRWMIFWMRWGPTLLATVMAGIPIAFAVWTIIKTIRSDGRSRGVDRAKDLSDDWTGDWSDDT